MMKRKHAKSAARSSSNIGGSATRSACTSPGSKLRASPKRRSMKPSRRSLPSSLRRKKKRWRAAKRICRSLKRLLRVCTPKRLRRQQAVLAKRLQDESLNPYQQAGNDQRQPRQHVNPSQRLAAWFSGVETGKYRETEHREIERYSEPGNRN